MAQSPPNRKAPSPSLPASLFLPHTLVTPRPLSLLVMATCIVGMRTHRAPVTSSRKRNEIPKIVVKKEPTSPGPAPTTSRRRPPKLLLNENEPNDTANPVPRTAGGTLTTMRDVGMACLSPGFATQDPSMREQLQRSISVRDHQRSIIEARLHRQPKTAGLKETDGSSRSGSSNTAKRRPPPNGLSIVPPSHKAFANERIVQSAPLHQTFTGRHQPHHPHHPPSQHTSHHNATNRLPPISDVFASDRLDRRPVDPPPSSTTTNNNRSTTQYFPAPRPGQPSPGHPSAQYPRPREHRSAEEALQQMTGGREDLLPRIVHYPGGHQQPPTPPSPPHAQHGTTPQKLSMNGRYDHPAQSAGRRRGRDEFEQDFPDFPGERDSPETKRRKKEEFLALCARAWELFHS
ncbi:hypothetical protein EX30DRAFT_340998 [Ascodesmis nigricans]|uniref:Uncharacterized protein n=1 Tax=Ascodesmis nigricans TaxID=341454 RepID=A0A4S2MWL0_9PEZI|nr:hypothetical protein EX30DRAFT_340998 [Ascodesmis nigricans]